MSNAITTARSIVATLYASGVRTFVIAPGSRSAPLAYALASLPPPARVIVRIDERAAAFTALGAALASGEPTAVITTSGTAVANLHPALAEADAAAIPLLAVTADRPRELWGTGANQTTWQVGMFATVVRDTIHLDADATDIVTPVLKAVRQARGRDRGEGELPAAAGPVHLNVSFTPPLHSASCAPLRVATPKRSRHPVPAQVGEDLTTWLSQLPNPVVVAGDKADRLAGLRTAVVAAAIPVLAEPSANLLDLPVAIDHYHRRLQALQPDIGSVVVAGHPTLSRPITHLLSRTDLPHYVLTTNRHYLRLTPTATPRYLPPADGNKPPVLSHPTSAWLDRWQRPLATTEDLDPLSSAAWQIFQCSHNRHLVIGASSVIRALDRHAPRGGLVPIMWANRGLGGIDGTIATAWGIALQQETFVRVVCGDLTFLHDVASLNCGATEVMPHLQIIVLDDGGGSIFTQLEHGEIARTNPHRAARYQRYFTTEQRSDITAVARGFGITATRVDTAGELDAALKDPPAGVSVLHVQISSQYSAS
ncbi:MAG: 2-succinyl-5-enolpyruvyl-6-hydroxy-3-cyclohexene-1-carboxylic-acid synthase [Bowdeniella nasicola]|nr:2-succinyl-5-enolpyruvyl-6-hydroxy-3-cyclohexene-1-carboxylic-acid synthase [Bowdeniella nasicola]